jgi:predicted PurR-regulated permease PerM
MMAGCFMSSNGQSKASLYAFMIALLFLMVPSSLMIAPFFLALTMGGILALLAWPIFKSLQKMTHFVRLAAVLVTCFMLLLVLAPLLTFSILALRQAVFISDYLIKADLISLEWGDDIVKELPLLGSILSQFDFQNILLNTLESFGKTSTEFILQIAKEIPQGSIQMILVCLTCYFMLVDGRTFLNWSYARIPLAKDVRERLTQVFHETAISVIWASMAAALSQAIIMVLAFLILKVPAAFLAGGLTFIFAFIPLAGSAPIWLGGAVYLYLNDEFLSLSFMLVFGLVTSIVDNLIRPWILKGRNEMHPLVSLVSIFGGIQMFGLYGVFLGPILIAVFLSFLQLWPLLGSRYGVVFDTGYEDTFTTFDQGEHISSNSEEKVNEDNGKTTDQHPQVNSY